MRLDSLVHSLPRFYQWKLGALGVAKRCVYRVLFIDQKIDQQRKAIESKNHALMDKYVAGRTVLEIGCGHGSLLSALARSHGCRCVGVDLSSEMINYAIRHNPGPDYQVMDSSKLSFPDRPVSYTH